MLIVTADRPVGEVLRDEALSRLRAHRAALVRRIQRAFLRHILECGPDTSDPVRDVVPIPSGTDPRVVGTAVRALAERLFRHQKPAFSAVGHIGQLAGYDTITRHFA